MNSQMELVLNTADELTFVSDYYYEGDLALYLCEAFCSGNPAGRAFLKLPPHNKLSLPEKLKHLFYLTKIEVFPQFRRKGIGSLLLDNILAYAMENNTLVFNRPVLFENSHKSDSPMSMEDLNDFYSKNGFQRFDDKYLVFNPRRNGK